MSIEELIQIARDRFESGQFIKLRSVANPSIYRLYPPHVILQLERPKLVGIIPMPWWLFTEVSLEKKLIEKIKIMLDKEELNEFTIE